MRYLFDAFVLDLESGQLLRGSESVRLRPQTFELLRVLVDAHPRILTRDELLDQVWGTEHVSANSLPQGISELRQALADDAQQPRFIETVHRRGYRFVCPVERQESTVSDARTATEPARAVESTGVAFDTASPEAPASRAAETWRQALVPAAAALILAGSAAAAFWWLDGSTPAGDARPQGASTTPAASAAGDDLADRVAQVLEMYRGLDDAGNGEVPTARRRFAEELAAAQPGALLGRIEEFRARFPRPADLAVLDVMEAQAAGAVSDFERQAEAARRAYDAGAKAGASALTGRALLLEIDAEHSLGRLESAALLAEKAAEVLADAGDVERQADALGRLGELLAVTGDVEGGIERLARAEALAEPLASPALEARLLTRRAALELARGATDDALQRLEAARSIYRDAEHARGLAEVAMTMADLVAHTDGPKPAETLLEEAIATWEQLGDRRNAARAWNALGTIWGRNGDHLDADRAFDRALEAFQAIGDQRSASTARVNLATIHSAAGRTEQAEALLREAVVGFERTGDRPQLARARYTLGQLELRQGELDAALAAMRESLALFRDAGARRRVCFVERKVGELEGRRLELAAAEASLTASLTCAREIGDRNLEAHALTGLGQLALDRGRLQEATAHHEQALEIQRELSQVGNAAVSDLALARVDMAAERYDRAESRVRAAFTVFRKGSPGLDAEAQALLAQLLARSGRQADARASLEDAAARSTGSEHRLDLWTYRIEAAHARGLLGEDTVAELDQLAATVGERGLARLAYRARLAAAEIASDEARLTRLIEQARAAEAVGVANRAAAWLAR